MRTKAYALFAFVIAAVMVSTGVAVSVMNAGSSGASDRDQSGNQGQNDSHGHNETNDHDNETNENETFVLDMAGGGGWFLVKNATNMSFKDTFGLLLNGRSGQFNNSSMVFQARDAGLTIHATSFTTIAFDAFASPGNHTAHATGTAVAGGKNWTFRLQITDVGKGTSDLFLLILKSGNMTLTWQTKGLGGGNIWVEPLADMDEMQEIGD